jgi:predicted phage tail protein
MEKEFVIRSYGYCEIAMLYFPNSTKKSASAQLGRWIRQNESLKKQWVDMGFKSRKKILTPIQVRLIVKIFGEP